MELSKERINELFEQIDKIKHRIARVIGNMEEERKNAESKQQEKIQNLFLAITELLEIVELIYNANSDKK